MEKIRGIPDRYLAAACLVLTFLLFTAGGIAFRRSPFYGAVFIIIAILLFFAGRYFAGATTRNE